MARRNFRFANSTKLGTVLDYPIGMANWIVPYPILFTRMFPNPVFKLEDRRKSLCFVERITIHSHSQRWTRASSQHQIPLTGTRKAVTQNHIFDGNKNSSETLNKRKYNYVNGSKKYSSIPALIFIQPRTVRKWFNKTFLRS